MQTDDVTEWTHSHAFHHGNPAGERGTWIVLLITLVMMVVEITAGWWFNSMALLADGWHMSSHALAIGLSALAYYAARRMQHDKRFTFGTWKIEILGGFASAVFLVGISLYMVVESVMRMLNPVPIRFNEAIAVACLGLATNVVSALIIGRAHHHDQHSHTHGAHGGHHHHDLNLKSAYIHVIADALTSVLAIVALLGGKYAGWGWLDPVMGVVGAGLIVVWAIGLARDTSRVLLDCEMDHPVVEEIRTAIAQLPTSAPVKITDLHVWRVGRHRYACIISLMTSDSSLTPTRVRAALAEHEELAHITVEINLRSSHARDVLREPS